MVEALRVDPLVEHSHLSIATSLDECLETVTQRHQGLQKEIAEVLGEARTHLQAAVGHLPAAELRRYEADFEARSQGRDSSPPKRDSLPPGRDSFPPARESIPPAELEQSLKDMEAMRIQASQVCKNLPQELDAIRLMKVELKNSMQYMRDLGSRAEQATSRLEKSEILLKEESALLRSLCQEVESLRLAQGQQASPHADDFITRHNVGRDELHEVVARYVQEAIEPHIQKMRQELATAFKEQVEEVSAGQARGHGRLQQLDAEEHKLQELQAIEGRVHALEMASMASETKVKNLAQDDAVQAQLIAKQREELDGMITSLQGLSQRLGNLFEDMDKIASKRAAEACEVAVEPVLAQLENWRGTRQARQQIVEQHEHREQQQQPQQRQGFVATAAAGGKGRGEQDQVTAFHASSLALEGSSDEEGAVSGLNNAIATLRSP